MKKHEIVYPIFILVSELCHDMFWTYLYQNLAYNICPFRISIINNVIYGHLKNKNFNYNFSNKDANQIHTELTLLFKQNLNIHSELDKLVQRSKFDKFLSSNTKTWKDIKKKNIKDILIENYVLQMKKTYNLSSKETLKLLCNIIMGLQFKIIDTEDIEYDSEKNIIVDIKGIDFHSLNDFLQDLSSVKIVENQSPCDNQCIMEVWNKYIG